MDLALDTGVYEKPVGPFSFVGHESVALRNLRFLCRVNQPHWNTLYSFDRFGSDRSRQTRRSEFERDWDRLVFSSAFRRLQNKTQVFPLPQEVFVHNRLTHSLEVASVGRSLGEMVGHFIADLPEVAADALSAEFYRYHLKHVVASACLAHDLGNPAFGHSGEEAISQYFIDRSGDDRFRGLFSESEWADLIRFEGNANALRLLTHQFNGRLPGGFNLTYSTLGAMIKYPCDARSSLGKGGPKHRSKYGFFQAEKAAFEQIVNKLHFQPDLEANAPGPVFHRHPFVFLVEAADDICYSIVDYEDAHRLGIFSTEKVRQDFLPIILLNPEESPERIERLASHVSDANEYIAFLRAKAINALTLCCVEVFVQNWEDILQGRFKTDLISANPQVKQAMQPLMKESVKHIYNHKSVVKIELAGFRIMGALLEDFVDAAIAEKPNSRQRNTLQLMPEQYHIQPHFSAYERVLSVLDFASGMTDLYALKLFRNLRGIEVPGI